MTIDGDMKDLRKIYNLTKSQAAILKILHNKGKNGITPKELVNDVSFAPRTVRYALRTLLKKNLIKRKPCLMDMRQWVYIPN